MRAFAIDRYGEHGLVRELVQPKPGRGELLVRVNVAGVNPADWKTRDGWHGARPFPLILGIDYAGVVEAVGSDVVDFTVGDRVFGAARAHGSFAEYTVVPVHDTEQPIAMLPASISDDQAAALPVAGLTALAALARLDVHQRDSMLVIGATGAVGSIVLQIARRRGIRTIATARSSMEDVARGFGADDVIAYDCEDVLDSVKRRYPDGISAVLDLVSDSETIKRDVTVLSPTGRIASALHAVDDAWFAARGVVASNIAMYRTPQSSRGGLEELAALIETGAVGVHVSAKRPLNDAGDVLSALKDRELSGKIVLAVSSNPRNNHKEYHEGD